MAELYRCPRCKETSSLRNCNCLRRLARLLEASRHEFNVGRPHKGMAELAQAKMLLEDIRGDRPQSRGRRGGRGRRRPAGLPAGR